MKKKNSNNDPLDLFPIPNDAIYINSKKNLKPRDKIISALKKYLKDKNLDLPLGPKLDLNNPQRSIILNKFDIQIVYTSLISDVIQIPLKNSKIKNKGPQLFLAAQLEEDLDVIYFKGVLKSSEFEKIVSKKELKKDFAEIEIENFKGGIDRLIRYVRLLNPESIERTYFKTAISNFKIPSLKIKFKLSTPLIASGLMAALIGPQIIRPRLIGGIAKLSPSTYEIQSFTRSSDSNSICLLTPTLTKNINNNFEAKIKIDKPVIYSLKPLNEINISKNGDIVWKRIASSKEKINGPINWPLNSINKKDSYRLSLRPEGSGMGSKLEIDFVFDKNIPLLNKDNIEKSLGKSKSDWISFIKRNLDKDNNTALTILLSERAPSSQRIKKSIKEIIKTDNCK